MAGDRRVRSVVTVGRECCSTMRGIARKGTSVVQKGGDGDLVGGVVDGRGGAGGEHGLAREAQAWEAGLVDGAEFEREESCRGSGRGLDAGGGAFRMQAARAGWERSSTADRGWAEHARRR